MRVGGCLMSGAVGNAGDLRRRWIERLGVSAGEWLVTAGWHALGGADKIPTSFDAISEGQLTVYCRRLVHEFAGLLVFRWSAGAGSRELHVEMYAGLMFRPAQAFLAACAGSDLQGVAWIVPEAQAAISSDAAFANCTSTFRSAIQDVMGRQDGEQIGIDQMLAALSDRSAVPFAGNAGDIPACHPSHMRQLRAELVATLLAFDGRYVDARNVLSENQAACTGPGSWAPPQYKRTARQVRRYIDAAGRLEVPTTPPRYPPGSEGYVSPRVDFSASFASYARSADTRRAAVDVVAAAHLLSRTQIEAMLASELRSHGVSTDLSTAAVLADAVEARQGGWKALAWRATKALVAMARRHEAAAAADAPHECQLPERAAYPVAGFTSDPDTQRWGAVELDSTSSDLWSRIWAGLTNVRVVPVDVWLGWEEAFDEGTRLAVYCGEQRVGLLDADLSDRLRPVLQAASDRDEDPWMRGCLTPLFSPVPFLLEIPVP